MDKDKIDFLSRGFFRKNRSLRDECSPQPRQTRVSISSSKAIFHPRLLALVSVSRLGLIRFSTFKTVEDFVHATISRKEEKKKKKTRNTNSKCMEFQMRNSCIDLSSSLYPLYPKPFKISNLRTSLHCPEENRDKARNRGKPGTNEILHEP